MKSALGALVVLAATVLAIPGAPALAQTRLKLPSQREAATPTFTTPGRDPAPPDPTTDPDPVRRPPAAGRPGQRPAGTVVPGVRPKPSPAMSRPAPQRHTLPSLSARGFRGSLPPAELEFSLPTLSARGFGEALVAEMNHTLPTLSARGFGEAWRDATTPRVFDLPAMRARGVPSTTRPTGATQPLPGTATAAPTDGNRR